MRVADAARVPADAQHGEGRVRGEEILLLALDVGLGHEVDVLALVLRYNGQFCNRIWLRVPDANDD